MRSAWINIAAGMAIGIGAAGISSAAPEPVAAGDSVRTLEHGLPALAAYPGARALIDGDRVVSIFGVPMTAGATPQDAAARFWAQHGAEFGEANLDLRPTRTDVIANGSTVIAYQQYLGGLPVEHGIARIVIHPDGNRVTLASVRLAQTPAGGLPKAQMAAVDAKASVKARFSYKHLEKWSDPVQAIYAGSAAGHAMQGASLVWKFTGENELPKLRERYTFFVDAATGRLLEARDEVLHIDITGKVQGKATPGLKPDTASNPPVNRPLELIRVIGGSTVETNALGDYLLPNAGSSAITVSTALTNGKWVRVMNDAGAEMSLSQSVTPPGPGDFLFNSAPTEFTTAQVNAFIGTTDIHNYFRSRAPSFTALDTQMTANVNINGTCNAFYDGSSINFYRTGGGCQNSAYADVIAHEYGHHIVNRLGLAQNAFGEGYSDSCSVLLHDTHLIGNDICGPGCSFRDIDAANKQYPCSGGIHDCGQVVGGVWRDMRLKMTDKYTSAPALDFTRQIHVDWSLITVGEQNTTNGLWPQSAIEVMTADDDDGTILNGCPNYAEIKYAFNKHNIPVPIVKPVNFSYPDGLPTVVSANAAVPITVDIIDGSEHSIPSTAQILYRTSASGPFYTETLIKEGDGLYRGAIPGVVCGNTVEYKLSINTTETPGGRVDPETGLYTYSVVGTQVLFDNFDGATSSFTVTGQSVIPGKWTRVDPIGTTDGDGEPIQTENAVSGAMCWVTSNTSDITSSSGETILNSPAFSLSGVVSPVVSYHRWFYNSAPADTGNYLIVEISNDGGASWTMVEQVGPAGTDNSGGWVHKTIDPTAFVAATANMKVRFRAADKGTNHIVEAALDDFGVFGNSCDCPADFDNSGFVDTDDFDAYVQAFEAGGDDADFDGSGFVDTDDIDAYVLAFLLGC